MFNIDQAAQASRARRSFVVRLLVAATLALLLAITGLGSSPVSAASLRPNRVYFYADRPLSELWLPRVLARQRRT